MEYAIIQTGGKQYRVQPGDTVDVEKLSAEVGSTLELDSVLLVSRDGEMSVGAPTVPEARVIAEVQAHGRGKKLIVFKYKPKVRYRRKQGHRQAFTRLAIREIALGEVKKESAPTVSQQPGEKTAPRRRAPTAQQPGEKTAPRRRAPTAAQQPGEKSAPRRRAPTVAQQPGEKSAPRRRAPTVSQQPGEKTAPRRRAPTAQQPGEKSAPRRRAPTAQQPGEE